VLGEDLAVPREVVLLERRGGQRRLRLEEIRELLYERFSLVQEVPDMLFCGRFFVCWAGSDG
jgi:hypothetical protein